MKNSRDPYDLHPPVRKRMLAFVADAEMRLSAELNQRVKLKFTSTTRDHEWQDAEYAKGRTAPGKISTKARGGDSIHNWGCAVDFALEIDGVITWDGRFYQMLGAIAKEHGITWGGDWNENGKVDKNDWDLVHFQWTDGLTLKELQAGKVPRDG